MSASAAMTRRRSRKKYNRIVLVGAFVVAAIVGILIGVMAGFIFEIHTQSKDRDARMVSTASAEA